MCSAGVVQPAVATPLFDVCGGDGCVAIGLVQQHE